MNSQLKIGALMPRSDMYPALAKNFLNGLKLAFRENGSHIDPTILIESIGNGIGDVPIKSSERMILQEEADVVISFCSHTKVQELVSQSF